MQKIVPHLWFDSQAGEAADFYVRVFPDSKEKSRYVLEDTPSGDALSVSLTICGMDFMFISAGPYFTLNPSVSFMVACQTKEEVDSLHAKLVEGGSVLMPLDAYPYSERYSWVVDKFGVSWQLIYVGPIDIPQRITPTQLFVGDVNGKCEEAIRFYVSIFKNAKIGDISRYGEGALPDLPEHINYIGYTLEDVDFAAMDSALDHQFSFNEAISYVVFCENQEEIDYYWNALSFVPEAEQCGWLKDKYGFSWQIVPSEMDEMMTHSDPETQARITQAFLQMKKFDIAELKRVYEEK